MGILTDNQVRKLYYIATQRNANWVLGQDVLCIGVPNSTNGQLAIWNEETMGERPNLADIDSIDDSLIVSFIEPSIEERLEALEEVFFAQLVDAYGIEARLRAIEEQLAKGDK